MISMNNLNFRTIRYRIADNCNHNCSYCSEHNTLDFSKFGPSKEQLETFVRNLEFLFKIEKRQIKLFIWGGEPLLSNNFNYFFDLLKELNYVHIELHSNLSNPNLLKKIEKINLVNPLYINTSYHFEYSTQKFISSISELSNLENVILDEFNIMLNSQQDIIKYLNLKDTFKESKFDKILAVPTFQLIGQLGYKKLSMLLPELKNKDTELFNIKYNFVEIQESFNPFNLLCNVPKDSFIVNTDGTIYLCQEYFMKNTKTDLNFYNSLDFNVIKFLQTSERCKANQCKCEFMVKKEKIE